MLNTVVEYILCYSVAFLSGFVTALVLTYVILTREGVKDER